MFKADLKSILLALSEKKSLDERVDKVLDEHTNEPDPTMSPGQPNTGSKSCCSLSRQIPALLKRLRAVDVAHHTLKPPHPPGNVTSRSPRKLKFGMQANLTNIR